MHKEPKKNPIRSTIIKILHVSVGVVIFLVALQTIRFSLQSPDLNVLPLDKIQQFLGSPHRSLAIGWLGTTIIMSGSPISALGVTLFASGIHDNAASLAALIFGSRISPNMILFVIGLVTLLKGKSISRSFSLGIMEFFTTASLILLSMGLYFALFRTLPFLTVSDRLIQSQEGYLGIMEVAIDPIAETLLRITGPAWGVLAGLGLLGLAIIIIDKFFSFVELSHSEDAPDEHTVLTRWWYRWKFTRSIQKGSAVLRWLHEYLKLPVMAFLLGGLVTALTLSTTVSVALILPFYVYKLITERSVIAYVLAANITTFIDTFFIAALTQSPTVIAVVLGVTSAVTIVVLVLVILFRVYSRGIMAATRVIADRPIALIALIVIAACFPIPILLL